MDDITEQLIVTDPITVRRRVSWGECDPAGVVYTPHFANYAASACDFWMRHALGHHDRPHPSHQQVVFPMRAMSFDFVGMLRPDDVFDMQVGLTALRTRTFTVKIMARHTGGAPAFTALLARIAFDQATRTAVPIPEALYARLSLLMQDQADQAEEWRP